MDDLIEQLFTWKKPLDIIDNTGKVALTVYQRLVGDSDLQKARIQALSYSRAFRKILRDSNSDEYKALIEGYEDFTKDELINTILFDQVIEIGTEVQKDFYFPEPVEPAEDATTEEMEKYYAEKESWTERRADKLNKLFSKEIERRKKEYSKEEQPILLEIAKQSKINSLCEIELRKRFQELCTYLGTYSDKKYKKRLFDSFEVFMNSADNLKTQLIEGYSSLEMSSVNLKGLQNPTS